MMAESTVDTPDWYIAREGISLLLNNKIEEADALFNKNPNNFHIKAGKCFYVFMNALMSFEEDKLQQAILLLREVEKECAGDIGWLKSVKNKVFGSTVAKEDEDYVRSLERQVILADTQVCSAILTLLQQEISSYVRAGWMLRKAWRVYQHTYNQILELYQQTFGSSPSGFHSVCTTPSNGSSVIASPASPSSVDWSIPSIAHSWNGKYCKSEEDCSSTSNSIFSSSSGLRSSLSMLFSLTGLLSSEQHIPFIEPSEVIRLMAVVSFGYGIFQLCVSLLPPSLLKLTQFLGFEGVRQTGLAALMYSRHSKDMRAPLATLALLWYHTIVKPFFGLDFMNTKTEVETAKQLILENQDEFNDSALFLFFKGRIKRLESDINGALGEYQKAVYNSQQREVKLLCLHEVAWCHLISLNYGEAHKSFRKLQHESRWSALFYAYLSAVCCGSDSQFEELVSIYQKISNSTMETTRETQQLTLFISRRFRKLMNQSNEGPYTTMYYRLLVYELLYLWNAISSCTTETLQVILQECRSNKSEEEPMVGLRDLIEGTVLSHLGETDESVTSYRSCLEIRSSCDSVDHHISAFALYELGVLLCNDNKLEEGKAALTKVQMQYKDYDFENRLNVRINTVFKHLRL